MQGLIGRLRQIAWTPYYEREIEADFLVFYRIADPWSLPGPRFFRLALRLPYYQGAMRGLIEAQTEDHHPGYRPSEVPTINSAGVDMRHNMAAAKAAGKGVSNPEDIKVVPAATWISMVPAGTVEHVKV